MQHTLTHATGCLHISPLRLLILLAVVGAVVFAGLPVHTAFAQTDLGELHGSVTDSSGAVIGGASVEVVNQTTDYHRATAANASGLFSVPSIPPGDYDVTVAAPGFQSRITRIRVNLGQVTSLTVMLQVGQAQQTVKVVDHTLAVETSSHQVALDIGRLQMTQLPNDGRSPLNLATLGPAATSASDPLGHTSTTQVYNNTGNAVALGGGTDTQTGYLLDGMENVTLITQTANLLPSVEAVQQMTVITNGAGAQYADPGIVNIRTRSGTDAFHGTAYDFLQNNALDALPYNFSGTAQSSTPLRYNLFGGNVGGPILKRRLYFFFDYSGLRDSSTTYALVRVPTALELNGDFTGNPQLIYDPASFNPKTGTTKSYLSETGKNALPAGSIDAFSAKFLRYFPAANIPFNSALNVNYQKPLQSTTNFDEYFGRLDVNISPADQLYVAAGYEYAPNTNNSIVPNLYGRTYDLTGYNGFLEETHIFSANVVNTLRVGYNRSVEFESIQGAGQQDYAKLFGLNNLDPLPQQWAPPTVAITSFNTLGYPYAPQGATQNRFQYGDELDYIRGKHTLSLGGEFLRTQFDADFVILNNGSYTYDGTFTSLYTGGARSKTSVGIPFADFLLGYPYKAGGATGISAGSFRESQVNAFIQDDWQALPSLVLNLGLRYQFDNPPNDKNGNSSIYDLPTNRTIPGTWDTNYGDFAPRVGFAWAVNSVTAVHGGFGIYYTAPPYNFLQFLLAHAPNFVQQSPAFSISAPVLTENAFVANPSTANQTPQTLAKHMPDVNVQEFNLFVDHTFRNRYLASVGYAGEIGRHESVRVNANQPNAIAPGTTTTKFNLRPYTYIGDVFGQYNIASSNSNLLEAKLERQAGNGDQFLVAYDYGRSMDISDGDRDIIPDYYEPSLTYAPSAWDRKQVLKASGVYNLPLGPGRALLNSHGAVNRLLAGGWQASGIYLLSSGLPVSVTATNNANSGSLGTFYAQRVCDPEHGFTRTRDKWFNTSCLVQTGAFQYGAGGRNGVRQPRLDQLDLGVAKTLAFVPGQNLQIRVEGFNVLNHPQLGLPGSISVISPALGALSTMQRNMRVVQVALRYSF